MVLIPAVLLVFGLLFSVWWHYEEDAMVCVVPGMPLADG